MSANTPENDDRRTPPAHTVELRMSVLSESGRAQDVRPLPGALIRAIAREISLYRLHARRTLLTQVQRSAFAMYRRQVEILRDRVRARKRNPILYTTTDFERQLGAVREFRHRFEALAQAT